MVVGDTHANVGHWKFFLNDRIEKENPDVIVQVGDFGYWPNTDFGKKWLGFIRRWCKETERPVYWLDGNHEDFDALDEHVAKIRQRYGILRQEATFIPCYDDAPLFYIPRGSVWEWDGVRFAAMGGAFSIDRKQRIMYSSWWPQETIKYADVDKVVSQQTGKSKVGTVDILFSHDAPDGVKLIEKTFGGDYKQDDASRGNRKLLGIVVDALEPKLLIHGHMHHRYDEDVHRPYGNLTVRGLSCDGFREDSYTIMEIGY